MALLSRRAFVSAVGLGAFAVPRQAWAQAGKVARLGILSPFATSDGPAPSFHFFHERLRDLGLVEGRNIVFEYRWAEGRYDRLPALAVELVQNKMDILLTAWSTPAAMAAKRATTTIPIVFIGVGDAVGVRLVEGLARPGGNITGSTFQSEETVGKLLQLLKEVVPKLSRLGTVSNPANPVYEPVLKDVEAMGKTLGLQVLRLGITGSSDVDAAFDTARRERVDGLVVMRDFVLISQRDRIVGLAAKNRLPVMYGMREFVDAGGLMSFEPSLPELHRRAADLVDKILKGARPAELPVEQSSRFELVINLKTAQALGLTIPPLVRLRADQVIE
jgi:putative tryptophan/tyrosine transport system substrate-binding protein